MHEQSSWLKIPCFLSLLLSPFLFILILGVLFCYHILIHRNYLPGYWMA